ncbi:MAG: hypothetical protein D6731_04050, partial [Planctomycetota bacterium]
MTPRRPGDSDDDLFLDSGEGPSVGDLDSDLGPTFGLESDEGPIHGLGESMDEDTSLLPRSRRARRQRAEAQTDLGPVPEEASERRPSSRRRAASPSPSDAMLAGVEDSVEEDPAPLARTQGGLGGPPVARPGG